MGQRSVAEFPSDVDGDGTPDFMLKDDRFDYAFAPYTESHKPPRIFNIEGAKWSRWGKRRATTRCTRRT